MSTLHPNATFFIKIKFKEINRKVQVASQPAPNWTKLSSAIISRFGIPADQPIGLQYRDSDLDLVTISSQIELDELWDEIKSISDSKSQLGSNHRLINFLLVLVDQKPCSSVVDIDPSPSLFDFSGAGFQNPGTVSSENEPKSRASYSKAYLPLEKAPVERDQPSIVESSHIQEPDFPDPGDYSIGDSACPAAPRTQSLSDKINTICAALEHADMISPQLTSTLGGYAQMIAQFTGSVNDACSIVANRFQAPSTQASSLTSPPEQLSSAPANSNHADDLLNSSFNSTPCMAPAALPQDPPAVTETYPFARPIKPHFRRTVSPFKEPSPLRTASPISAQRTPVLGASPSEVLSPREYAQSWGASQHGGCIPARSVTPIGYSHWEFTDQSIPYSPPYGDVAPGESSTRKKKNRKPRRH